MRRPIKRRCGASSGVLILIAAVGAGCARTRHGEPDRRYHAGGHHITACHGHRVYQIGTGVRRSRAVPGADPRPRRTTPRDAYGKAYEEALGEGSIPATYVEYREILKEVFAECARKLEPGGRIAVNVANLGRKPYRSLSVSTISRSVGVSLVGPIPIAIAIPIAIPIPTPTQVTSVGSSPSATQRFARSRGCL